MTTHRDDLLGTHLHCGKHPEETDGTITNDNNCRAWFTLAASAANQPVPITSESVRRLGIKSCEGTFGVGDQGAVGKRDSEQWCLRSANQFAVLARGLISNLTVWTSVVEAKNEPMTN